MQGTPRSAVNSSLLSLYASPQLPGTTPAPEGFADPHASATEGSAGPPSSPEMSQTFTANPLSGLEMDQMSVPGLEASSTPHHMGESCICHTGPAAGGWHVHASICKCLCCSVPSSRLQRTWLTAQLSRALVPQIVSIRGLLLFGCSHLVFEAGSCFCAAGAAHMPAGQQCAPHQSVLQPGQRPPEQAELRQVATQVPSHAAFPQKCLL